VEHAEGKYLVQSLAKGLTILECFNSDMKEYGVTELAGVVNQPESTVQRIINTLEYKGYLLQNPKTKKYRLSLKMLTNLQVGQQMMLWQEKAKKHLAWLNEKCGETVNLAIRDGDKLVYIDKVDSNHLLRPNFVVGLRYPLYCTAIGKCLLLDFPRHKLKYLFPNGLEKIAPDTKADLKELVKDLDALGEDGYAIDDEEFQQGLYCISAPVHGLDEKVVAAVSISSPKVRITNENRGDLIKWILETTQQVSNEYRQIFSSDNNHSLSELKRS